MIKFCRFLNIYIQKYIIPILIGIFGVFFVFSKREGILLNAIDPEDMEILVLLK